MVKAAVALIDRLLLRSFEEGLEDLKCEKKEEEKNGRIKCEEKFDGSEAG